jgi:hypothetical protein
MINNWDLEEKAKDSKTYANREDGLEALNYIVKKYLVLKNRKIDPRKSMDDAINLIEGTLQHDKNFQRFALENYRVLIEYDERNDILFVGK